MKSEKRPKNYTKNKGGLIKTNRKLSGSAKESDVILGNPCVRAYFDRPAARQVMMAQAR